MQRGIAALPGMLQRIDDWIADGVLGSEQLNVADFQIAPSVRLATALDDLRPTNVPSDTSAQSRGADDVDALDPGGRM